MQIHIDEQSLQFLMDKHSISRGTAFVALCSNKGSVKYADEVLYNDTVKRMYGREAREYGFD